MPIDYKIGKKNFQQIGENIAAILETEFKNQWTTYENEDCRCVDVYKDRVTPLDETELTVVNVTFAASWYDNKHQGSKSADNTYYIDVYCNSKSTKDRDSDDIAQERIQKVLGVIDEVLEHPLYKKLGFVPNGIISGTMVEGIEIVYPKETMDALASVFGRVTLKVRGIESTGLNVGVDLDAAITKVYINSTTKGFKYELTQD